MLDTVCNLKCSELLVAASAMSSSLCNRDTELLHVGQRFLKDVCSLVSSPVKQQSWEDAINDPF